MKIIEAMKKVKANKEKIADLQKKIADNSAHLSIETPAYENVHDKIKEWAQSCDDLSRENVRLLTAIGRTNLETKTSITLGGKEVTKTLAEWIWRRREYAALDRKTWEQMGDRGLREQRGTSSTGTDIEIKIIRNFDPERRDTMVDQYRSEPHEIDGALEVVNAVTDLVE